MKVSATAKYVRMSPRKTRLLVDLVRGMSIIEARHQLQFSPKAASKPVLKVLNSAIANAQNNHSLDTTNFVVTAAFVNEGPTFYRYRPRAHGRSAPIRKRMSHITVEVGLPGEQEPMTGEKTDEKGKEEVSAKKKPTAKKPAKKKTAKN